MALGEHFRKAYWRPSVVWQREVRRPIPND